MKNTSSFFEDTLKDHISTVKMISGIRDVIENLAAKAIDILKNGGKLLIMGNGGSAADSQHMATEIAVRYKKQRKALPAIALTTDSSVLTAAGNDFSFDMIFSRQIEALATEKDMVIGISTSGNSLNVLKGIECAKDIGCTTAALLGSKGGAIASIPDLSVIVPSSNTPRVQECHILIIHIICEMIENEFIES
ncbi:MAG: SIS domain-containing protein [Spirochaetes bacterium]|nr:SIS domain-containing protein [Spirochaetota bacterium]